MHILLSYKKDDLNIIIIFKPSILNYNIFYIINQIPSYNTYFSRKIHGISRKNLNFTAKSLTFIYGCIYPV